MSAHPALTPLAPSTPQARSRLNLALGGGLLVLVGVALLAPPSRAPRRSPAVPTVGEAPPSAVAPTTSQPGAGVEGWVEEVIPLRADLAAVLAVHPEGEIVCTAAGGNLEMQALSGHFTVDALPDGSFRLRATRPTARGETAAWCGGTMFSLRLRAETGAPRRRRLWLSAPPVVTSATRDGAPLTAAAVPPDPTSDPRLQRDAAGLLEELLRAEGQGPGGEGAGEWGKGERAGLAFAWRRALRRGELCGAVLDLINRGAEPYFFEPTSLEVDLPGRGVPPVLARSGQGMILPGGTQPAIVIWHEPRPPGAPPAEAGGNPPAGPYTLRLRPWPLPWRELVAVVEPPAAAGTKPRRVVRARAVPVKSASPSSIIEAARHPQPIRP